MRILAGLLREDGGTALVLGKELLGADRAHRARVALLFVLTGLAVLGTLVLWFVQTSR